MCQLEMQLTLMCKRIREELRFLWMQLLGS